MVTIGALVKQLCSKTMAAIVFVVCLPRFVLRRVRKWSKLEEEDMETDLPFQHNSEATPPSWLHLEEGLAHVKVESLGEPEQTALLNSTPLLTRGHDKVAGALSEAQSPNTDVAASADPSVVESLSCETIKGSRSTDPVDPQPSPFSGGLPGLEVPSPWPLVHCQSDSIGSHDLPVSFLMQRSSPLAADRCTCPLSPGPSRSEANRQRPTSAVGPFLQSTITRSKSAPIGVLKLEPRSSQESEEKDNSKSKDAKAPQAGQQKHSKSHLSHLMCAVSSDIGQRKSMEDYHVVATGESISSHKSPRIEAFLGVFDGHNGPEAAKFSSENLMHFLLQEYAKDCGIAAALKGAFQSCEDALFGQWKGGLFGDSGTTGLACVIVSDGHMHLANVGDCRAVLSKSGRAEALTKDHRPGSPDERARIIGSGGFLDSDDYLNGEIGVSRAIGDFHLDSIKKPEGSGALISEPDLYDIALGSECEFVIMASDGLWDVLSNQRAVDIARGELDETQSAEKAAEKLVFEAKLKESRDNITVGLVVLRELPFPARKSTRKRFVNSRLRLNSKSLMDLKQALQTAEDTVPRPV